MANQTQYPQPGDAARLMHRAALVWCSISFVAVLALYARSLRNSLDGDYQGWASASCLTMARAFNALGALHTHFVPIQNNLPLGSDPDVYLHWPPLYPLVLSMFLRIFGDSPAAGRILELLIVLVTSAVVMLIARYLFSPRTALLAGFFYLACRATFLGASAILQQPLAMLFASLSVLLFLYAVKPLSKSVAQGPVPGRYPVSLSLALCGVFCIILSILTAWDPIFIPFGLLAVSIYLRHRSGIRLAGAYIAASVLTFIGVQADYMLSYPTLFQNQFATIAYRAGLHFNGDSSVRLHTIVDRIHYIKVPILRLAVFFLSNLYDFLGPFSLLTACIVFAIWLQNARLRENHPERSSVILLFGFGFPWIVWCLVMRNYASIHSFVLVMATPFVAISSAVVLDRIWASLSSRPQHRCVAWTMVVIFPAIILLPLILGIRNATSPFEAPSFSDLSSLIEHSTPPDAVVLAPYESMVPVYLSRRHTVRGIQTDQDLQNAIVQAHVAFPVSLLFLAMQDDDRKDFPKSLPHLKLIAQQGTSAVYKLSD